MDTKLQVNTQTNTLAISVFLTGIIMSMLYYIHSLPPIRYFPLGAFFGIYLLSFLCSFFTREMLKSDCNILSFYGYLIIYTPILFWIPYGYVIGISMFFVALSESVMDKLSEKHPEHKFLYIQTGLIVLLFITILSQSVDMMSWDRFIEVLKFILFEV